MRNSTGVAEPDQNGARVASANATDTWAAFVAVLCIAVIVDNAPYPRIVWDHWVSGEPMPNPSAAFARSAWVAAAAWALIRPKAFVRYFALCAIGAAVIVLSLPTVPNHWVLLLGVFAGSLATSAAARDAAERFSGMRALVLGSIVVVYTWTFVHKLNAGFLDPATSCSAVFIESLAGRLRLPPPPDALRASAVWAVLVTEGAMPVLLLWPRFRGLAVLLGIGLHLAFGLFVAAFSVFMWATYFLLLAPGSLEPAFSRGAALRNGVARRWPSALRVPRRARGALGFVIVFIAVLLIKDMPRFRGLTQQETLLLPLALVVGGLLVSGLRASGLALFVGQPPRRVFAVAAVFSVLLALNGAVPYAGVRNTLAFSMFSNLRTEPAHANHLFLPSAPTGSVVGSRVRILETSDPVLSSYTRPQRLIRWNWTTLVDRSEAELELPFFMVRYRAQELRDSAADAFSIRYEKDGETFDLSSGEVDALPRVNVLSGWLHWSRGTPLPPRQNACMW